MDFRKELTREESCYEELNKLFSRREHRQIGQQQQQQQPPDLLEEIKRIARQCRGAFRLKDRNGYTLLHHACYCKDVTVEMLALLRDINPDAIHHRSEGSGHQARTPLECITWNMSAPHEAFRFMMEQTKPNDARDPFDFYLELRFLCRNQSFPTTAAKLRSVVEACPEALSLRPDHQGFRGRFRGTPLQTLCSNETATLEAVKYLYEACPDAISFEDTKLPLHHACYFGLPSEIIHFLIDQYPEAVRINRQGTPLHLYLNHCDCDLQQKYLYSRGLVSTTITTTTNTTEEELQSSAMDINLVRRLVEVYPQALQVRAEDMGLGTPLHIVVRMYTRHNCVNRMELLELIHEMARISPGALRVHGGRTAPLLHHYLSLFSCEDVPSPLALIDLLVDIDAGLLTLPTNLYGELPIHVVCNSRSFSSQSIYNPRSFSSKSTELLKYIIERAPESVLVASAGWNASLPIHQLLNDDHKDVPMEAIQLLVESDASMLGVPNHSGDLPLHVACQKNKPLPMVQYILTKYPEATKIRNNNQLSPLDVAIRNSWENQELVEFLLEKDPDIAGRISTEGVSCLHIACRFGSLDTIKKIHKMHPTLIQLCNNSQQLPLHYAVESQDLGAVAFLLQEYPNSLLSRDRDGLLPFHTACRAEDSDSDLIELLFKCYPAAIHTPVNDGRFPIQLFCGKPKMGWRDLEVLRFLACQLPYSLGLRDAEGRHPLHLFCQQDWNLIQDEETLKKLHELCPDAIRHESEEFGLPIHCACKSRCGLEILKLLVELYPDSINHKHKTLGLPLHCAIGNTDEFQFLLEKRYSGDDAEQHVCPLFLHALLEDEELERKEELANFLFTIQREETQSHLLVSQFKRKGTGIERLKDDQGRLPLHLAVSVSGGLDDVFIKCLIDKHPDALRKKDHQGKLPLHHSFQNGAPANIVYLLMDECPPAMTTTDNNNNLPIHLGSQYHREEGFMKGFITNNSYLDWLEVDINDICKTRTNDGDLPLHKACIGGNLDCISSLVAANPLALRTRNNSGMIPVFLLCQELGKDKDDFEKRGEAYVSAIFDLLKPNPEAILLPERLLGKDGKVRESYADVARKLTGQPGELGSTR